MVSERQNNSRYEVFLALSRLANADNHIRFFKAKVSFSDDKGRDVTYSDAHCYKLSCGYRITNIGIFDSKSHKINISRAYEKKLYLLTEKKYNSIKKQVH